MKKDIQNVVITFSLIAVMLYGGSFFYAKKVTAEEAVLRVEEERLVKEFEAQERMQAQLLKINLEQERQLAEQKLIEERVKNAQQEEVKVDTVTPTTKPIPKNTVPVTPTNTAAQQAASVAQRAQAKSAADAQAKAQSDALAAQIAAAKAASEKLAQQKADAAAAKAAAQKASRKSKAS